jgi:hypothetical protein
MFYCSLSFFSSFATLTCYESCTLNDCTCLIQAVYLERLELERHRYD